MGKYYFQLFSKYDNFFESFVPRFCERAHIQGGSYFHELEGGGRSNQKNE